MNENQKEIESLKSQIAETKDSLRRGIDELQTRVQNSGAEIREAVKNLPAEIIQRRPMLSLALSLGAGAYLGNRFASRARIGSVRVEQVLAPLALGVAAVVGGEIGKQYFPDSKAEIQGMQDALMAKAVDLSAPRSNPKA